MCPPKISARVPGELLHATAAGNTTQLNMSRCLFERESEHWCPDRKAKGVKFRDMILQLYRKLARFYAGWQEWEVEWAHAVAKPGTSADVLRTEVLKCERMCDICRVVLKKGKDDRETLVLALKNQVADSCLAELICSGVCRQWSNLYNYCAEERLCISVCMHIFFKAMEEGAQMIKKDLKAEHWLLLPVGSCFSPPLYNKDFDEEGSQLKASTARMKSAVTSYRASLTQTDFEEWRRTCMRRGMNVVEFE